jgi:hypothetical protein
VLGIEKMLSGVVVRGDALHVDTQIVDVRSGVIEGSTTRDGRRSDVPDRTGRLGVVQLGST